MPQYTPVDVNSNKDELDAFLERVSSPEHISQRVSSRQHRVSGSMQTAIPWALAAIFGTLSLFLIWERDAGDGYRYRTYEEGFDTDIGESLTSPFIHKPMKQVETDGFVKAAVGRIPLVKVRFGGSPRFFPNGTGYVDEPDPNAPWPENMKLFGPPTPEVDANWDRLIGDRYFAVSKEEAVKSWGDKRHEYWDEQVGGYTAG